MNRLSRGRAPRDGRRRRDCPVQVARLEERALLASPDVTAPTTTVAAIMFRDRAGFTAGSLAPWNAQIGLSLIFGAVASSAPPQTGTAAANRSGRRARRSHVPNPPIDKPVM